MIPDAETFVALRTSDDPEEQRRATHEPAPEAVWREVVERDPEMRVWVARNKTVPLSILDVLSRDGDPAVRHAVASKRKLSRELFERLAADADEGVRRAVASNAKAPAEVLRRLAADPWSRVAEAARGRLAERGDDPPSDGEG